MTTCDRFEREGLITLERGDTLDEHFLSCPDCNASREAYDRLKEGISEAAAVLEPPVGWQARVRSEIEEKKAARSGWRSWMLMPAGLAAAALAIVLLLPGRAAVLTQPGLATAVVSGDTSFRTGDLKPQDRLLLTGTIGVAPFVELRLYLNDRETIVACSTEPPCVKEGETVSAEVTLLQRGRYQAVVLVSDEPIPAAAGDLDGDVDQALESGALVELGELMTVR